MALGFDDYVRHDGLGLAERIRRRDISAAEALEAAIARAEAVQPKINAIVARLYETARDAAGAPRLQGPFAGVPFAIKDLIHAVQGAPLTNGSRAFADQVMDHDSEGVRRFRAAGLNVFATSASPEFGLTVTTESALNGATRNPWNLERSTGGSSGGAAALVAAGVIPLAHATDGGGSIRVPAAACGLFGLKVSRGRTPSGDTRTEGWNGLGVSFAVTRSVRDAARLLDCIHGPEASSRYAAPVPAATFASALDGPPPRLRVAWSAAAPSGVEVHADCRAAVEDVAGLLADLGHHVEEAAPELEAERLATAMARMVGAHTAATLDARAAARGRPIGDGEVEPVTAAMAALGRSVSAVELIACDDAFMAAAAATARFHARYDIWLTPTLARPPARIGELSLSQPPGDFGAAFAGYCPFTALANQTGQPAMNLPLHWNAEGLPIGVQALARVGEERLLLALAGELEAARPWFGRRPPL